MNNYTYYRAEHGIKCKESIFKIAYLDEIQETLPLILEKEFWWLYETESKLKVFIGDKLVKEGSIYSDFYGFCTSLQEATTGLSHTLNDYKITSNSDARIVIETCLNKFPAYEIKDNHSPQHYFLCRAISSPGWYIGGQKEIVLLKEYQKTSEEPADFEKIKHIVPLRNHLVLKEQVWDSSKNNINELEMDIEKIIQRIKAAMPIGVTKPMNHQ